MTLDSHKTTLWVVSALLMLVVHQFSCAATFTVTRQDDPAPANCQVSSCTLREAVIAANALAGSDMILIPSGTVMLELPGADEDAALSGDLDITDSATIESLAGGSVIDAQGLDRIFDIAGGVSVRLAGLSLRTPSRPAAALATELVRAGVIGAANASTTQLDIDGVNLSAPSGENLTGIYMTGGQLTASQLAIDGNFYVGLRFSDGQFLRLRQSNVAATYYPIAVEALTAVGRVELVGSKVKCTFDGACQSFGVSGQGQVLIDACTIEATSGIAVYASVNPNLEVLDSTLIANNAKAIQLTGSMQLSNSTVFADNAADIPAVEISLGGSLVSTHATLRALPGAKTIEVDNTSSAKLINSVVIGRCGGPGTFLRQGNNIESPGNTCSLDVDYDKVDVSAASLALGPLQNNGGETLTLLPSQASALVDAVVHGSNDCPPMDQRKYLRTNACDIGAVEANGTPDRIFANAFE